MRLFYSGPESGQDSNSEQSIGGYVSSTPISNGGTNNVFSPLYKKDILSREKETKLLILKNITPSTITSLELSVQDSEYFTYKIALIIPNYDDVCKRYYFEVLPNKTSLPFDAILTQHTNTNPLISQTPLGPGVPIGIWISREVKNEIVELYKSRQSLKVCSEDYIKKLQEEEEAIDEIKDSFYLKIIY